ncbi:MAG: energy transducer TonB [Bacteroidales bacterium]|nr:energy transducer TonB [Bacteroidales bacterium]
MNGKNVCAYLKSVRQKVAEANGIDMEFPPCHYEGDCKGTCPRCEAEVAQLERELSKRQQLSMRVAILGIAAGLTFAALPATAQTDDTTVPPPASDLSIDEFYIEGELPDLEEYAPYERAQFPGGQEKLNQYLVENINYPSTERHWNGTIWIMFIIEKDGSIGKVEILSGGPQVFDDEAIRLITNMPKWIPAKKDGVAVADVIDLPIRFYIQE